MLLIHVCVLQCYNSIYCLHSILLFMLSVDVLWLTRCGLNKMTDILLRFSNSFSWTKSFIFWLKFNIIFFPSILISNKSALVLIIVWYKAITWTNADQVIWCCIAWPGLIELINSLWPSDAVWRQRSGSTLAQVMACCLTAPSHYLN